MAAARYWDDLFVNGPWNRSRLVALQVGELDPVDDVGEASFQ